MIKRMAVNIASHCVICSLHLSSSQTSNMSHYVVVYLLLLFFNTQRMIINQLRKLRNNCQNLMTRMFAKIWSRKPDKNESKSESMSCACVQCVSVWWLCHVWLCVCLFCEYVCIYVMLVCASVLFVCIKSVM